MARKDKKKAKEQAQAPVVEKKPVDSGVVDAVVVADVAEKPFVVNCHKCGAALHVQAFNVVYMCPVCNSLLRVRFGERLVKDVSQTVVAESYVNVVKKPE